MKHLHLIFIAIFFSITSNAQVAAISGPTSVCNGNSVIYTDATSGGYWSSGSSSVAMIGSSSGVLAAISPGVTVISYTVGSSSVTYSVTVNSVPGAIGGMLNVCEGYTTTLTCSGGSTWSSSNSVIAAVGTTSGIVTGQSSGTANITCSNSAGCYAMATVTVVAMPLPAIAAPPSVCEGGTITFTNLRPGGTWSCTNTSIALVGSTSGIVTGLTAGTADIVYSIGPSGCSVSKSFIVNSTPPTPSGQSGVCLGGSITLTNTVTGGAWTSSNPTVASVGSTGVVTGLAYGTTNITYGTVAGCFGTRPVTVTTAPSPINPPWSVCSGDIVTITDPVPGGAWTSSDTMKVKFYPTYAAILFPGTAIVTYSLGTGCTVSSTFTVLAVPASITGSRAICPGTTSTLSCSPIGGTWSSSSTAIATISGSGVVTGTSVGTAWIYYTISTGCRASAMVTVNSGPAPLSGPGSVCIGSTASISEPVLGGAWVSSNPSVGSISSTGIVTGVSSGTFTISYSLGSGCAVSKTLTVMPASCSGTPTPGTTNASQSLACVNTTILLSLSGASSGCGIQFQWQSSTDGSTYTNITGANATTYTYNITGTAYYRCKLSCTATGLFSYSSPTLVTMHSTISSQLVFDSLCNSPNFYIAACGSSSTYNVTTWFGDGASSNTAFSSTGVPHANVFHTYNSAGTYTVKQVLYIGTLAQDSISFTYVHYNCNSVPIKFFFDANHNGVLDTSEMVSMLPAMTEIDSNGIAIDSISATSGFYYRARGGVGTVYTFRVTDPPAGMIIASPTSGFFRDTIKTASSTFARQNFGLVCASGVLPQLSQYTSVRTGRHTQWGNVQVSGQAYCTPVTAAVTLHYSTKYHFTRADPAPASTTASTAVWNLVPDANFKYPDIHYYLDVPSAWLIPGDTVTSSYITIDTMITDTANHYLIRNDTVKSSFDPNEIEVSPTGNVLPCAPLQYTIGFANTGNDTAKNITVVDTLSDNVDIQSLKVQTASSEMNVTVLKGGLHNVVKFDLPGINLPDSTHSQSYTGLIVFSIQTRPGIADGTTISNQAGIIFDDNPPVMTNVVANTVGISAISGRNALCEAAYDTLFNSTGGGMWSVNNTNATVSGGVLHGITAGVTTISYSVSNSCTSRTATKIITVNPLPSAGTITGSPAVCESTTVTLNNTVSGGTWTSSMPGNASITAGGIVTGILAGSTTISYTTTNSCGTAVVTKTLTVNPLPASISGSGSICAGATTLLTDITVGGTWGGGASVASINSSGLVNGISAGSAVLTYSLPTGCSRTFTLNVNALPVTHNITGGGAYCAGGTGRHVGLSGSETGVTYTLYNGTGTAGSFAGTGAALDMGAQSTPGIYTIVANAGTSCSSNMTGSAVVSISPLPTAYNIIGGGAYCSGGTGLHIGLNGSTNGISYTLYKDGAPAGTFAGTGSPMDMGTQTVAGIYTISATDPLTTCTSSMTGSTTISVNPLPAAIGGGGTICAGANTALTDASPGGTWSGSTAVATIDAFGAVTALLPGTATITYTLPAGCSVSTIISVSASPAVYDVTGGGAYCAGSGGVHVGLNNSETGITYTLYNSSVAAGTFAGTGAAIDMGVLSAAGDYTVIASNNTTSCVNPMSGHASVVVNPLPAPISADVTTLCAGVTSTYRDATAGGTWSTGVSGVVSVDGSGLVTALLPGTTSVAYTLPTGCSVSQTVVVNALPNPHNVTGGGSYCAGGHGVPVGLASSEPGITYTLYEGATMIGTFAGTGSPVDMGLQTNAGTYTVTAVNTTTFCMNSMTGSASVVENPLPAAISGITPLCENQSLTLTDAVPGGAWSAAAGVSISTGGVLTATAAGMATVTYTLPTGCFSAAAVIVNPAPATFNVTGGGNYCSGDAGVRVGLDGSSTAVTYTLYNSGVAIGTFIGTGSPIDFGVHTAAGTYTVGGIIPGSGCRNDMAGVAVVGINAAPDAITGSSSVCVNGSLTLASTTPSGSWTSSTPSIATVDAGTGIVTAGAAGTTTIWYTLPTGCKTSKVITTKALPAVYNLTGGGDYCAGTAGVHIGLNNSQTGVTYNLQTGSTTATTRTGTGGALDFGLQTAVGTYTVGATNDQSCSNIMYGTATVGIVSDVSPSISITSDPGTSFCKGSEVTFNAHPTNGGTSPRYRWQVNGIYAGNSSSYQYRPHEGDVVTSELTSNALCALPATASASITMHEIAQPAPTLTITGNPGLSIEPGQTLTLRANVSGAGSALEYQWVINTSYIAGATQSTYTSNSFANNDSLTCIIVTGNGCGTVLGSATVAIGVGTTGIASLAKEGDIQLQPNPNSGSFSIIGTVPDVSGEINVTVTNALGQTVYSGKSQIRNGNIDAAISLDKNLASGTYLLKLQSGDYSKVLHFVITR